MKRKRRKEKEEQLRKNEDLCSSTPFSRFLLLFLLFLAFSHLSSSSFSFNLSPHWTSFSIPSFPFLSNPFLFPSFPSFLFHSFLPSLHLFPFTPSSPFPLVFLSFSLPPPPVSFCFLFSHFYLSSTLTSFFSSSPLFLFCFLTHHFLPPFKPPTVLFSFTSFLGSFFHLSVLLSSIIPSLFFITFSSFSSCFFPLYSSSTSCPSLSSPIFPSHVPFSYSYILSTFLFFLSPFPSLSPLSFSVTFPSPSPLYFSTSLSSSVFTSYVPLTPPLPSLPPFYFSFPFPFTIPLFFKFLSLFPLPLFLPPVFPFLPHSPP